MASTNGFASFPSGIMGLLSAVLFSRKLMKKYGAVPVIGGGFVLSGFLFLALGYVAGRIWHFAVIMAIYGLVSGSVMPLLGPVMSSYCGRQHPRKLAIALAVPTLGANIAKVFGQSLTAYAHTVVGVHAWTFLAVCQWLAALVFVVAYQELPVLRRVSSRLSSSMSSRGFRSVTVEMGVRSQDLSRETSAATFMTAASTGGHSRAPVLQ